MDGRQLKSLRRACVAHDLSPCGSEMHSGSELISRIHPKLAVGEKSKIVLCGLRLRFLGSVESLKFQLLNNVLLSRIHGEPLISAFKQCSEFITVTC